MTPLDPFIALVCYASVVCGALPLYPWLAPLPRIALIAGLATGIWQSVRGAWPVKTWTLNVVAVPVILYYLGQFSRANPVQPVVSMLAVMLSLRLVAEKSVRHYTQILMLSLFCLASSSLFDLSPRFLVYLIIMLVLIAVSLVLLTFYEQDRRMRLSRPELARIAAVGLLLPLVSLPLMLMLFPVLPRTQIPLWDLSGFLASRITGMSDKVEPGLSSATNLSPRVVFRAQMTERPQRDLYWRAVVFNRFDGTRWARDGAVPPEHQLYGLNRITLWMYPEPLMSRYLVTFDATAQINASRVRPSRDGVYESLWSGAKRRSYQLESIPSGVIPVAGGIDRAYYLRLPESIPERILQRADGIRRRGATGESRLQLLERFFRNGDYTYSQKGMPTGPHALERFLFQSKQGNCEFFASSFALLARSAGLPARVVGGYLGGEYNEVGSYYLVRESMAHVWVEVYLEGRGWLRVDPSSFARNAGEIWGGEPRRSLLLRLRMALDSLDHAWNRSVIGYDFERQVDVASGMFRRLRSFSPRRFIHSAGMLMVIVLAGIVAVMAVVQRRLLLWPSREKRLLRSFYRRLERDFGLHPWSGGQGLFELAEQSGNRNVLEFVEIFAGALYRDRKLTGNEYGRLKKMLRSGFGRRSQGLLPGGRTPS